MNPDGDLTCPIKVCDGVELEGEHTYAPEVAGVEARQALKEARP